MSQPTTDPIAQRAKRILHQKLESLDRAGVSHLARPRADVESLSTQQSPPKHGTSKLSDQQNFRGAEPTNPPAETSTEATEMAKRESKPARKPHRLRDSLAVIQKEVAACTQCPELVEHRTQTVFGVGNPKARLCFLGEAPGADEDRQGEPFVGRAGKLLDKIIEACTLRREDVYILNILKCRPPGNRNPEPKEAANCRQFLDRQLALIKPEFICCLGAVAVHNLLETTTPIGKMRGQLLEYRGIKVVCTYHPAYLLRNPPAKRHTWDDMKLLMREMGIALPNR